MDPEQVREQKLQELKEQMLQKQKEEESMHRAEAQLDTLLRQMLTEDAKVRLTNVRMVNQETYAKAVQALMYLNQSGRVRGKLGDQEMKDLLGKLSQKRETTIRRK